MMPEFEMTTTSMKFLMFSLVNLGLLFNLFSSDPEFNDLMKFRLKGSVKSVMETRYTLEGKGKNAVKDKTIFQKYTAFDQFGFESESILYNNGEEYLITKYIFGREGKQSEMNQYQKDGRLNLGVTYKYDEDTLRSEAIYNWSEDRIVGDVCEIYDYYYDIILNEIFTKVSYKYEYRGYCTEENYIKPDSGISFKITSKYDFRGNRLESAYFRGDGILSWITKYSYDRYDNMVESRVFKSNRIAVLSEYKYQFDEKGNWTTRREEREVYVNILTAGLEQADILTERTIEYY
jgi:hypothetical protein